MPTMYFWNPKLCTYHNQGEDNVPRYKPQASQGKVLQNSGSALNGNHSQSQSHSVLSEVTPVSWVVLLNVVLHSLLAQIRSLPVGTATWRRQAWVGIQTYDALHCFNTLRNTPREALCKAVDAEGVLHNVQ
jgi:hypothetical protein